MPNPILGAFGGGTATLRLSRNVEGAIQSFRVVPGSAARQRAPQPCWAGSCDPGFDPRGSLLNGFAAIEPAATSPAIGDLAAKCTTIFDAFRAPMAAQERARRVASGLNQGQIANLDRWGYPYWLPISDFT
jgi:hypothetical protein